MTIICKQSDQGQAWSKFWVRVREHQGLYLVPAGQVHPPPQPRKSPPPNTAQDEAYTYG